MFQRAISNKFKELLHTFRCLSLTGARQVGKTFFLRNFAQETGGTYWSFDDPLVREEANRDALGWLTLNRKAGKPFVIDEAIKCPEIFSAVKITVDREDPVPTQIILASSGNYLLLRQIRESLAGRVVLLKLFTLSWPELHDRSNSRLASLWTPNELVNLKRMRGMAEIDREREQFLLMGGFPEVRARNNLQFTTEWFHQYFATYVLPLAVDLFQIAKQRSFERTFYQLALRTAQLLNYSDIATTCDISSVTVKNYIHYLTAMMLCEEVPQFFPSRIKQLVKSPKLHMLDPALVLASTGVSFSLSTLQDRRLLGPIYESWIYSEIEKASHYESQYLQITTFHTQSQSEVDLILMQNQKMIPIEIKYKKKIARKDLSGIKSWLEAYDEQTPAAYIIYPGHEIQQLGDKIWALPDYFLFGVE
ncbi:MAG: ATP-binding protein [Deltaproteobacteria bacterium]|nr:ATP-binding protein [Deltaproteobacteria bacterium]